MSRILPMDGMQSLRIGSEYGPSRTYARNRDGTMTVSEADAKAAIREGVAIPANAGGPTAHITRGFACSKCGRRNYFRRCGACGTES